MRNSAQRGAALLLLLILFPIAARGDVTRCYSALQGEVARLSDDINRALESCASSIRRARENGEHLSRAADQCDRSLMKVHNAGKTPGRSAVDRFRANLERMHPRKCNDADLLAMGYFVPGINAPGARGPCLESGKPCVRDSDCTEKNDACPGAMADVIRRLATQAENAARQTQLQMLPDLAELISAAINLEPGEADEFGTDPCSRPPSSSTLTPNHHKRPNLCLLQPFLPCTTRQCTLSVDSSIGLFPKDIPIKVSGRTIPLEICAPSDDKRVGHCTCPGGGVAGCVAGQACVTDFDCGSTPTAAAGVCSPDVLYVSAASQQMVPPPVVPVVPFVTTCIEMVSFQGWCDCGTGTGAQGAPFSPQLCIDHLVDSSGKDDCGASTKLVTQESACGCSSVAGVAQAQPLPPCTTADCDECVGRSTGAPCHAATRNGPLHEDWSGASAANDCAMRGTMRLSFLPPAFCRDANGEVRGVCDKPGAADAACAALGGVKCVDPRGANGAACDGDDDTPWTFFPVYTSMTTGMSTSRVADWVMTEGICTASGNLNCIEDGNCKSPATCLGATFGCGSGPGATDCQVTAGPGAGISCANLRAGALGGWKLVGSVPRLDQPALGDGLLKVMLECD